MSDDDGKRKAVEKQVQRRKIANLERALKEERLALTAIATAFVQTHGDADALFAQLERMVQAAATNPRTKPRVRQTLIDGHRILERALAVHRGRPQPLFDDELRPSTGHVNPSEVRALANPEEESQQALALNGGGVAEAEATHRQLEDLNEKIDDGIVRVLRDGEPDTDIGLYDRYCATDAPRINFERFYYRRTDLTKRGRLVDTGEKKFVQGRMRPTWDIIERKALV